MRDVDTDSAVGYVGREQQCIMWPACFHADVYANIEIVNFHLAPKC